MSQGEGPFPEPAWLELADDEPTDAGRRRAMLLAVAIVPWGLLTVLLLRPPSLESPAVDGSPEPSPSAPPASLDLSPGNDGPVATPPSSEVPTQGPSIVAPWAAMGARTALGLGDVAAAAVPVVRAWLGDVLPTLDLAGLGRSGHGYVEHVVVEALDHPGPGAVVASALAVVLPVADDDYGAPTVLRVAVPLMVATDGVRPGGDPWLLPPPDLALAEPTTVPIDDPDVLTAAAEALGSAGYQQAELEALGRTDGWVFVADITAIAPGETSARRHRLWLRPDQRGFVVAGWLPRHEAAPPAGPADPAEMSPRPSPTPT